MTSQKDQIQALIAEIDGVLQRANPRLPWVMSGEAAQQRQVLERVRNYLVSQQPIASGSGIAPGSDILSQDLYYQPSENPTRSPAFENATAADATTQQLLEKVLQEISQLRVSLTPPNQHPASAELLQVLMNRLQENLAQQIAQTLNPAGGQAFSPRSDYMLAAGIPPSALSPSQYEQLQALRRRPDQVLVNLDTTLNIVFESLQRNIQTYQDSLSQGLERMYSLGQQSEITFKALVELLAQQLQQEASAYLPPATDQVSRSQSVPATSETDAASQSPDPSVAPVAEPAIAPEALSPPSRQFTPPAASPSFASSFPYAGTEILSTDFSQADLTAPANPPAEPPSLQADPATNAAIAAWLNFAKTQDQQTQASATVPEPSLPALDLSDLELGTATSSSPGFPAFQEEVNQLPSATQDEEDSTEIDAALKLLENLSAELDTVPSAMSLEDAEAQLDAMLGSTLVAGEDITLPEIPNDARDELDEFYQSLFGASELGESETEPISETLPESASEPTPTPIAPAAATPSANEELFLENLFEATPTLPPLQLPDNLLDDLTGLEESPTQPDLVIPPPPAVDSEAVTFSPSNHIRSLSDLFSAVKTEQERSTPVEPPIAASSDRSPPDASLIEIPFEQTYTGLSQSEAPQPPKPPSLEKQEFGFDSDPLEEQYTRAAFDENLLPDASEHTAALSLELDEMTLGSLNEDLANLETFGYEFGADFDEPAIAQPGSIPQSPPPALTLDEFAADLPQVEQPSEPFSPELSQPSFSQPSFNEPSLEDLATALPEAPLKESEGMNDLFGFASPPSLIDEVPSGEYTTPFTLEGMDDLFEDAPAIDPAPPHPPTANRNTPIKEIPPFKPQIFTQAAQAPETGLPPFKLERLDSLFTEGSTAHFPVAPDTSVTPDTPVAPESPFISDRPEPTKDEIGEADPLPRSVVPSSEPTPVEPDLTLDQAFESLLGPIASPGLENEPQPTNLPTSEKKN